MKVSRVSSWLLACLLLATYAGSLQALEVKKVSVHLLLSPSGAFSDDITE
jgi:hypothetical protein